MNLPPDKARLLRQYDNEKKWDLICDQVQGVGQGWEGGICFRQNKVVGPKEFLEEAWPGLVLSPCLLPFPRG